MTRSPMPIEPYKVHIRSTLPAYRLTLLVPSRALTTTYSPAALVKLRCKSQPAGAAGGEVLLLVVSKVAHS